MPLNTLKVFEILRPKFDEEAAKLLTEAIDVALRGYREELKDTLVTKTDLREEIALLRADFKEDMAALRVELKEDMAALRVELKEDMAALRVELKEEIAALRVEMHSFKAEVIKWMFLFWIGQAAFVLGAIRFLR